MVDLVKKAIVSYGLLNKCESVTVALSGGADSVALLLALLELKNELSLSIYAAHLNHCLRGEEADRDEQFVRDICEELNIPLFCEKADVKAYAKKKKLSIELAAREVRYAFLERVAVGKIATAHTLNDQIETVIHNIARGTGIAGACGIPKKNGRIIRPLIMAERSDVESFLKERNVQYCTDSTNLDMEYTRNMIRKNIVPLFKEINSNAVKNVGRFADNMLQDADYLRLEANQALEMARIEQGILVETIKELHPAILSRVIMRYIEEQTAFATDSLHITQVIESVKTNGFAVSLQGGYEAVVKNGILKVSKPHKRREQALEFPVDELPFEAFGYKLSCVSKQEYEKRLKFNNLLLKSCIDCDTIVGKLVLRTRKDGDKIKLFDKKVTKSFKKLFCESKTDLPKRDNLAVLEDESGVLFLYEFGASQKAAVTEQTKKVLIVEQVGV